MVSPTEWRRKKRLEDPNFRKKESQASMKWKRGHLEQYKASRRRWSERTKLQVFIHYSGTDPPQCANPFREHEKPYITIDALSIDHINNDEAEERKRLYKKNVGFSANTFYRRLINNNYPEGYQVLCMNCQWIKRLRHLKVVKPR